MRKPLYRIGLALISLWLGGCAFGQRLSYVGREPPLSPIENPQRTVLGGRVIETPQANPVGSTPASLPAPGYNSLWRTGGSRGFFSDQRARTIGDILTVSIQISDNAQVGNSTQRSRETEINTGVTGFFGLESRLQQVLPGNPDPGQLVGTQGETETTGAGTINRSEIVNLTVAAFVTQVLPNGNLVIAGRQEVRINFEVRELQVSGIIRPEDIRSDNTIDHTQIAEARISYGGRGHLSEIQKPPYGQELLDILLPF